MGEFLLKRGMNLHTANYHLKDELVNEKYVKIIRDAGFDHVRLPIKGDMFEEGGKPYWEHVREFCNIILNVGLIPIIDMHGYPQMKTEPLKVKDNYMHLWQQLAEFFADIDERVVLELFNEPSGAYNAQLLNEIQNQLIKLIRESNPTRWIAAATTHFNIIENLYALELPEDDSNIFVTIHDYTPMKFTHQGAHFNNKYPETGIKWGTDVQRRYMIARYDLAAAWAEEHNRHLHLGEFGVITTADMEQRAIWTKFVVDLCEERGIGWAYWDFWHDFAAYDRANDKWHPEILKALIH
ncbi:MAG: glycoside hydrolase family 5 protein [Acutalibacteraceae bacterium]|jgi:endoglucanase